MRAFVIFAVLVTPFVAAQYLKPREYYEKLFFDHIQEFKLVIKEGKEFVQRLVIFAKNVDIIEQHNADPSATFQMGLNHFAHLTFKEFLDTVAIGGTRPPGLRAFPGTRQVHLSPENPQSLPKEVDWMKKGAVTDVKNQGQCGSCWAFSATGALEGAYFMKFGNLTSFSEQELVSCAPSPNQGCNGGWMDDAFKWVQSNGGLAREEDYTYHSGLSGKSGECETDHVKVANSAPKGYVDVIPKDMNALMSAVAQQPVSIAIQADQLAFQFYKSGILTGRCGQNLDHGVLLVGYGSDSGLDFWKVKNSWSSKWGEQGYIRIEKSSADKCGVMEVPSYPIY